MKKLLCLLLLLCKLSACMGLLHRTLNTGLTSDPSDPIGAPDSDGLAANQFRIFVSSVTHDGNFGGLSGVDAFCQTRATAASLTRTYKAIMSTDTVNAKDHITANGEIYTFVGSNKVLIAASDDDLFNTSSQDLLAAPSNDEFGNDASMFNMMSGTAPDGTSAISDNCTNWTDNGGGNLVDFGINTAINADWLLPGIGGACSFPNSIYCISQ